MKNGTLKSGIQSISSESERDTSESTQKTINIPPKAVKTMPEQLVTPPTHVWDKIEAILDKQDERRNSTNTLIQNSFGAKMNEAKRRNFYLATVAGLSVLAGLFWFIR